MQIHVADNRESNHIHRKSAVVWFFAHLLHDLIHHPGITPSNGCSSGSSSSSWLSRGIGRTTLPSEVVMHLRIELLCSLRLGSAAGTTRLLSTSALALARTIRGSRAVGLGFLLRRALWFTTNDVSNE